MNMDDKNKSLSELVVLLYLASKKMIVDSEEMKRDLKVIVMKCGNHGTYIPLDFRELGDHLYSREFNDIMEDARELEYVDVQSHSPIEYRIKEDGIKLLSDIHSIYYTRISQTHLKCIVDAIDHITVTDARKVATLKSIYCDSQENPINIIRNQVLIETGEHLESTKRSSS